MCYDVNVSLFHSFGVGLSECCYLSMARNKNIIRPDVKEQAKISIADAKREKAKTSGRKSENQSCLAMNRFK